MSSENTRAIALSVVGRMSYQELVAARNEAARVVQNTTGLDKHDEFARRFRELDIEVQARDTVANRRTGPYHAACGKNHPLHEQCWGTDEMRAATEAF